MINVHSILHGLKTFLSYRPGHCSCDALCTDPNIRKKVFQVASRLESIALIFDSHLAGELLTLWWNRERQMLYRYYHDKLRSQTGNDQLFNELFGCLRNVYYNMLRKANAPAAKYANTKRSQDVIRTYSYTG